MKFNSQICTTREQSERLLSLGLKKETADMHHSYYTRVSFNGEKSHFWKEETGYSEKAIPAWSLHRMLSMLPSYVQIEAYEYGRKYIAALDLELDAHLNVIYKEGVEEPCYDQYFYENDAYKSVCRAIEWLIKGGYFNKEYLVDQEAIEEHCKGVQEYLDYIREED